MKRLRLRVVALIALLAPMLTTVEQAASQQEMIPSSAMAAVFAKPKAILNAPGMELLPREVFSVMGKKELGFDPCEITDAMLLVESFSDLENPPGFGLLLKFALAQQPGEKLTRNLQKGELSGRTIYRSPGEDPAFLQLDPNTIVIGMEPFLKKMLAAKGAQSQLINLINTKKNDTHLSAFVTVEPVRGLINDNLPPRDQVPPPFQGFLELPNLIESIVVKSHYAPHQTGSLEIVAVDEEAGRRIVSITRQAISTGRQMAMGYIASQMREEDPDLQKAVAAYGERIGEYIDENFQPKLEDRSVLLEFDGQQGQLANMSTTGILIGMLLPAVQQAREAARRSQSMNNLRMIALAVLNYESANRKFPSNLVDDEGNPLLSWRVTILPYIEEQELYEQFHLDEPWDSEHNIKLLPRMPKVLQSPNVTFEDRTVYLGFNGPGTIFGKDKITFGNITDGTSNTILAVEANMAEAVEWSKPQDIPFNPNGDVTAVGRMRPGGFIAVYCDGSVHFVPSEINPETLKHLIQRNDGNAVDFGRF